MSHIQFITSPVKKAANVSVGTYLVLAGQIMAIISSLFADKEIFTPEEEVGEE